LFIEEIVVHGMYDGEWTSRHETDGIVPGSTIYQFRCLLCNKDKDHPISTAGYRRVLDHIGQRGHRVEKWRVWRELKVKMLHRLDEHADGLSPEELMRLGEEKATFGLKRMALEGLIEDEAVLVERDGPGPQDKILWVEKAESPDDPEYPPTATGITLEQIRPAFVYLVKEKGMSRSKVAEQFGVNFRTVSDTVKRFEETGGFKNRAGQGRKRTTADASHVEEVRQRLSRNPTTMKKRGIVGSSTRKLSRTLSSARETIRRILKRDLGLHPYKHVEQKTLTPVQVLQRIIRGKLLRTRFANGRHQQIIFSDESPFVIEQHHNPQNLRSWSKKGNPPPKKQRRVERDMKPSGVMVWGAIGYNFKSKLQFVAKGVNINTPAYLEVMEKFEMECRWKIGSNRDGSWKRPWTFQQDGAPSHTSRITQRWLQDHFPDVITKDQWPAASPRYQSNRARLGDSQTEGVCRSSSNRHFTEGGTASRVGEADLRGD
jgi:transposase